MKKILASVILVTTLLMSAFAETYDGKCDIREDNIREWIAADAEIKKEISPNVSNEELTKYLFDMYGEVVSYDEIYFIVESIK